MTSGDTPGVSPPQPPPTPVSGPAAPVTAVPWPGYQAYPPPGYGQLWSGPVYPMPAPYQAPARRARWTMWVSIVSVLAIMVSGATFIAAWSWPEPRSATWVKGNSPRNSPPGAFASDEEWTGWARREVSYAVERQGKAMAAGDESAYLSVADPDNTRLMAELTRRYETVHAMGPGVWVQAISGTFAPRSSRRWKVSVSTKYCFGPPTCQIAELRANSEWAVKDRRVVLVKLDPTDAKSLGPRPWEAGPLTVRTGERVVTGTSSFARSRLPKDVVGLADDAAKVADTFAKWGDPPGRYVVFFAGPGEWDEWYGGDLPEWVGGFAIEVSARAREVVVLANHRYRDEPDAMRFLLTHEFTHASSLAGNPSGVAQRSWWLVEGVADYAAMLDTKVADYDGLVPTRSFVRGKWDGDPAVGPPGPSASDEEAAARYGVAFLAVRGIADRYGQEKMLDFFGRVVHDSETVQDAASHALGRPWSTVRAQAASFIRSAVTG